MNIEKDTLNILGDHPGIVRLYYTFQDERSLYFVLDLAIGGELLGFLKRVCFTPSQGSMHKNANRQYSCLHLMRSAQDSMGRKY